MKHEKMRIQKYMAECGFASRRKSEELIRQGKVKLNGHPVSIGDQMDPARDRVTVGGRTLQAPALNRYIMLYKPRGYVTTLSDEMNRRCVADLIGGVGEWVYPVGRLDRESEGLLIFTNDGAFAQLLAHPSGHVEKLYRVTVHPAATDEQLARMASGLVIDGRKTAPVGIRVIGQETSRQVLQITLGEGRNRQIRKMCEQVGLEVARLKRTAVGPLKLGMLKPGAWRDLTQEEVRALVQAGRGRKHPDRGGKRA